MRTLFFTLLSILLSSVCLMSCSDDKGKMPRLFRPSFIASSCFAEGNTINLAWRTSGEPTSYTVEIAEDSIFSEDTKKSQTVTGGKCIFENLKYETPYYVRVRANNEAMQLVSNWTVYESTVSTLARIVPKLLCPIDETNITENTVRLEWAGVNEQNPADGLMLWTENEMETGTGGLQIELSATEASAESYQLTGLSPRTVYYVALTNSAAPEGAESYNIRRFRTGGIPQGAITVADGAELFAKIQAGMEDDSQSELIFCLQNGKDYYLNENGAADGKTGTIALTKSIFLLANPGEHPTVYIREGGFQVGDNPHIDYFTVENIDIEENQPQNSRGSKTYLFSVGKRSAGENFTIDRFEIINAAIMLPTSVIMMNESNDGIATINHINIDNCLVTGINDTKLVTKQFGFIHAPKKGGNVWNDVRVSNSTFYEFYISPGVFGSLTANATIAEGGSASISNCTFYNWATSKASYTAIGDFSEITTPLNLTINACVFGYSEGKVLDAGSCNVSNKNNYCTSDFEQLSNPGITLVALEHSDADLFQDAPSGNFTIIDGASVVYQQEYGDPRWIGIDADFN